MAERPQARTAATAAGWLRDGRRVAAGLLVQVDGSAPLDVGASMYVTDDGTIEGSVTGGCVESAVAQEAMGMLEAGEAPRLVTYGISDDLAGTAGLMCGGIVHLLVHEVSAEPARDAALRAMEDLAADRPHAVATILDGPTAGAKLHVDADGATGGLGVNALLDRNVEREARGLIAHGQSLIRSFGTDGTTLGAGLQVHFRVHAEAPHMLIFGAIDFAAALAEMARLLGYRVTIADPRKAFLESARFTAAATTVTAWPDAVFADAAFGPRDAILVFTHDGKLDVPALMGAFATDAGYLGALGSRQTTADREVRLRDAGASDADLARLNAPCGLDIGAATVEETALAVLSEITARRAGREGAPLGQAAGPIRGERVPTRQ